MSLVKVIRNGQITLPAEAREALRLKEGDYLEAEVVEGEVRLKPVAVDRKAAWRKIREALGEPRAPPRPRLRPRDALCAVLVPGQRAELLACLLGALEQLLRTGTVGGLERVERVAGDQLVSLGVHVLSASDSSSSSRKRASPANILLLIVPSGTPSISASSDCE